MIRFCYVNNDMVPVQRAYTEICERDLWEKAERPKCSRRSRKGCRRSEEACKCDWGEANSSRRAGSCVYWQYRGRDSPAEDENDEAGGAKADQLSFLQNVRNLLILPNTIDLSTFSFNRPVLIPSRHILMFTRTLKVPFIIASRRHNPPPPRLPPHASCCDTLGVRLGTKSTWLVTENYI